MSDTQQTTRAAIDWAAFEERQSAHWAAAEAIRPINKAGLFDTLATAGITSVQLTFDGYGDSGQIESTDAYIGDQPAELPDAEVTLVLLGWDGTEPNDVAMSLADAIEHLAYDCLAATHLGWENNDGAYGTFVFDVGARTIALKHNERFTDIQTYEHEL